MRKIGLIPYICGAGATTSGCETAPPYLEQHGLVQHLRSLGLDVDWTQSPAALYAGEKGEKAHQDLPPPGDSERIDLTLWHCQNMKKQVISAIQNGLYPLTIGGDHTISAGSISGFADAHNAHGKIGLIWFDAHPDLNTWTSSESGSPHGMPVAALTGIGKTVMEKLGVGKTVINPDHLFYIGIRSIDPAEQTVIDNLGIKHLTNRDVQKIGVKAAFNQALDALSDTDYLILSFDLDGLRPSDVPAVGTPVGDGIALNDVLPALEAAQGKRRFDMIEIVEFNPTLQGQETTYQTIKKLLETLLQNHSD
ncbi:MAG: arginase [Pseudomonadota bacterium]